VYQAYAKQILQFCTNHENDYILLQHFFHFIKEYCFGCNSMEEYYSLLASLSPLIDTKVVDSLNIYNGMNFSSFIEAILRIAYIKAKTTPVEEAKLEETKDPEEAMKPILVAPALERLLDEFATVLEANQQKQGKKEMLSEQITNVFAVFFLLLLK